jgi:hypothetical protein
MCGPRYAPAHVQIHAESSALGYLIAFTGTKKPPKTQLLHVPVGGRRFRPSLEDVVEFAVNELAVEPKPGWQERVKEGRRRWFRLQVNAAIRDLVKLDPKDAPQQLGDAVSAAERAAR